MRPVRWFICCMLMMLLPPHTGWGQQPPKLPRNLSPQSRISLLTISPGDELYSTFGHSAIRIVDPVYHMDRVYNYGTFSFDEPWFYLKFARGQLDYQLSAYPYGYADMVYRQEKRSVVEQILGLTLKQRNDVYHFLEINYLPENRKYRYDFFFDNCATRIRDVFKTVLGDSLEYFLNPTRKLTFRQYLDLYLKNHPFSDFGIDLGLGARADRIASPWEAMFLPDFLYESFDKATIVINGEKKPLVVKRNTLLWYDVPERKQKALPYPSIIFWMLLVFTLLLSLGNYRGIQFVRKLEKILDTLLYSSIGLLGILILLLWFATDHKVTPENWNLLWSWPTHILLIWMYRLHQRPRWVSTYFLVNTLIMGLVLLGWSWIPQMYHPAVLPIIFLMGYR
ncbi:MAG: DUF4105 domain-containing protein, partial [Calditrichaeota bacterium]